MHLVSQKKCIKCLLCHCLEVLFTSLDLKVDFRIQSTLTHSVPDIPPNCVLLSPWPLKLVACSYAPCTRWLSLLHSWWLSSLGNSFADLIYVWVKMLQPLGCRVNSSVGISVLWYSLGPACEQRGKLGLMATNEASTCCLSRHLFCILNLLQQKYFLPA